MTNDEVDGLQLGEVFMWLGGSDSEKAVVLAVTGLPQEVSATLHRSDSESWYFQVRIEGLPAFESSPAFQTENEALTGLREWFRNHLS